MHVTAKSIFTLLFAFLLAATATAQPKQATLSAALNTTALAPGQQAVVAVVMTIKPGFHAQSNTPKDPDLIPLTVTPTDNPAATFAAPLYPKGEDENYPGLGAVNVYTGKLTVYIPVTVPASAKPGPITLAGVISYQICDNSSCFAPAKTPWSIETKIADPSEAKPANPEIFADYKPQPPTRATQPTSKPAAATKPAAAIKPPTDNTRFSSAAVALLSAFAAGIMFNIVPCVLPVLPLKVLGFAEVAQHDRKKTLLLSSVFGLGIVTVFMALAILILVLHKFTWGEQFSNPWFAWSVVILLAVMALWMFGLLNFNLPATAYSFSPRHDTYLGNFEWGILTAILSTPCTGPLFPPLMLWAQSQPVFIGVPAVMMVGVGMASPYVFLSLFPELARKFPRVGPWAELFKQMMGFLLLGAAVFFAAGRFLHGAAIYWAIVPVAAAAAIYLMIKTIQYGASSRGITISSLISAALVGGTVAWALTFVSPLNWQPYSDPQIDQLRTKQIVLVKFTANWCLNCQYIERTVFHDKSTAAAIDKYHVACFKADLTTQDAPGWKRLNTLSQTGGIPLTAIYIPGQPTPITIDSVYTTQTLLKTLDQATPQVALTN